MAFCRTVVFRSARGVAFLGERLRPSASGCFVLKTRRVSSFEKNNFGDGGEASRIVPACNLPTGQDPQVGKEEDTKVDTDAVLAAFEKALETELYESPQPNQVPLTKKQRIEQEAEAKYLQRLEVLTALPEFIKVEAKADQCPGCGCELQSNDALSPGFVPKRKERPPSRYAALAVHAPDSNSTTATATDAETDANEEQEKKTVICQRCYKLNHYGAIAETLRVKPTVKPGPSIKHELSDKTGPVTKLGRSVLSPSRFRSCLEGLRKKSAIIVYLVDIFDFHGSFLSSLHDIVGTRNPILLAVNKVDLLPSDYKASRVERWVRSECDALGLHQVAGIHMVSSRSGLGVSDVLADAVRAARGRRCDIYVIGAANVGKSSFINKVVSTRKAQRRKSQQPRRPRQRKGITSKPGMLTTSVIPGTTLDAIRIPLGHDISLYDTPGIIVNHQLTNRLDAEELRAVLPTKNVERVTYRLGEGKSLYLGGLARIDIVEGKPFFFTVFVSSNVKVHPGKTQGAEEFLLKHTGELLTPPFNEERLGELGQWTSKSFTAQGDGWKRASVDIVLSGLGWVSITGPGSVKLRVNSPYGMGVFTREALMPFEVQAGASKYTGARAVNRRMRGGSRNSRDEDASFSSIDDYS